MAAAAQACRARTTAIFSTSGLLPASHLRDHGWPVHDFDGGVHLPYRRYGLGLYGSSWKGGK